MAETEIKRENTEATVAGLLAEFAGPEALKAAAARVRDAGFTRWDVYSPYPVHGIERAMGMRRTPLPWLVLGAGAVGAAVALLMQWWMNAIDYPHIISGKPLFSLPANIPITFELIVLLSAFAAFGGVLALGRLPQFWHPAFSSRRFRRVTSDGFFLVIETADPRFDEAATTALLEAAGATAVEVLRETATPKIPHPIYWAVAVASVLALLPPLLIARYRAVPKALPRIHIIQDMDFQERYNPQATSPLFADGRATRLPVPGTVAEGGLEADDHFYRGQVEGQWATAFPMPVTKAMAERGQQRYNVFCATCHGLVGDGGVSGITSARAIKRAEGTWLLPLSLHTPAVIQQPVGQLFNTITNGIRKMPAYGSQIPEADRWAIVLYIRALQRSQNAALDDVPEELRPQLR